MDKLNSKKLKIFAFKKKKFGRIDSQFYSLRISRCVLAIHVPAIDRYQKTGWHILSEFDSKIVLKKLQSLFLPKKGIFLIARTVHNITGKKNKYNEARSRLYEQKQMLHNSSAWITFNIAELEMSSFEIRGA